MLKPERLEEGRKLEEIKDIVKGSFGFTEFVSFEGDPVGSAPDRWFLYFQGRIVRGPAERISPPCLAIMAMRGNQRLAVIHIMGSGGIWGEVFTHNPFFKKLSKFFSFVSPLSLFFEFNPKSGGIDIFNIGDRRTFKDKQWWARYEMEGGSLWGLWLPMGGLGLQCVISDGRLLPPHDRNIRIMKGLGLIVEAEESGKGGWLIRNIRADKNSALPANLSWRQIRAVRAITDSDLERVIEKMNNKVFDTVLGLRGHFHPERITYQTLMEFC